MKESHKNNQLKTKLEKIVFEFQVTIQQQFFRRKIQANEKNLILLCLLILISALQEIQLITKTSNQSDKQIERFFVKYSLNFVCFNSNIIMFIILSTTQISLTGLTIVIIFHKSSNFMSIFYEYFQIVHHIIINLPILNIAFNFILKDQLTSLALSILLLTIIHEIIFCIFNVQNRLIEIEGCYSHRFQSLLYFFCQMLLCYFYQKNTSSIALQLILLLQKMIYIFNNIDNYNHNITFILTVNVSIISYIFALIGKQSFQAAVLMFFLLYYVQQQIRSRKVSTLLNDIKQKQHLYKYTLLNSQEFQRNFKVQFCYFQQTQHQFIQHFEIQTINYGQFSDKLLIIEHLYKEKYIQLYFNLINIQSDSLSYLEKIKLKANLLNSIEPCRLLLAPSLNIDIFIKSLEVEQQHQSILLDLLDKKTLFYKFLMKDMPTQQFIIFFERELNKILKTLEFSKNSFEKQYNLKEGRLKEYDKSDQASINLIKSFYSIFYGNFFKFFEIEQKENELLNYSKEMNEKILKNQVMLISISYIQNKFLVLNKDNKRSQLMMGNFNKKSKILDFLPNFKRKQYSDLIDQYVKSEFNGKQPLRIFLEINQYLTECEVYIHPEISTNDIILHHYFIQKSQANQFLIFDTKGKILGITGEIFEQLKKNSENAFNNSLSIEKFLESGMIQYYVSDIYDHLFQLCRLIEEGSTQNQINIRSQWLFPENHQTCLEQTLTLMPLADDLQNNQLQVAPAMGNIKLSIMQEHLMNQIQFFVVQSPNLKQQNFFGILELDEMKLGDSHYVQFILKFNDLFDLTQQQKVQQWQFPSENKIFILEPEKEQAKQNSTDPEFFDGLQSDYEFQEHLIRNNQIYTPLKIVIAITILMVLISIIALVACYQSNYQSIMYQQEQMYFLQAPQAMTFCYAEHFLINWNLLCAQQNLFELSPFIRDQRKNWFPVVFLFFNKIRSMFTLSLSEKSSGLGISEVELVSYSAFSEKITTKMNFFEFYTITQEALIRQYFDQISNPNPDYSIFMSNGIMRQNIITTFKYHDVVLNDLLKEIDISFSNLSSQNFMILLYITLVIVLMLITLTEVNCKILRSCEKIAKLLRFLNQQIIFEHLENLEQQKEIISSLFLRDYDKFDMRPTQKNTENFIQQAKIKVATLRKIEHYREKYLIVAILTLTIGLQLIISIFGSEIVSLIYNKDSYSSLVLSVNYLKLKNKLDSAILIGELIKTEQFIPNNNISFINQTENILFFLNTIDAMVNLSNQINDELVNSNAFNSTFKSKLIDIFTNDLCKIEGHLLPLCNVSNIKLEYFKNDQYTSLVSKGIYGLVTALSKLSKQEYNYEATTLSYNFQSSESSNFLHSQIHQNLFVSYYIDIQVCFYFNFLDLFTETNRLSNELLNKLYIYLITAPLIFVLVTIIIQALWVRNCQNKLNRVKLIATLFPPSLLHQKGFNKLLYSELIQIK